MAQDAGRRTRRNTMAKKTLKKATKMEPKKNLTVAFKGRPSA
jgi:hypothetical protein